MYIDAARRDVYTCTQIDGSAGYGSHLCFVAYLYCTSAGGCAMATLDKKTIQKLAALRALGMWSRGAYGPLRLQKTLFFADKDNIPEWRIFTFKKWRLGQYSDELSESLNDLDSAGRINQIFDGPSTRIKAVMPPRTKHKVAKFFRSYFPAWNVGLTKAFRTWAYLTNDQIIKKAHDDLTYKQNAHGDTIFESFSGSVEFPELDDDDAEDISDFVDFRLQQNIVKRTKRAAERNVRSEDWRSIYFPDAVA